MPVLKGRTVFEIARGLRMFLNLDAGLTRGEVPDPEQKLRQTQRQLKEKNQQLEQLRKQLSAGDQKGSGAGPQAEPGPAKEESQRYGEGLKAGDRHYRAWVGPPQRYDLVTAIQVQLLLAAGLRETHKLVDVGCGSLRAGRMLIPYLRPGHYFGVEPNQWVVEEGIRHELGQDLVEIKHPTFRYVDDFSVGGFGVEFDFALAQSVFTHTYPDLTRTGLRGIAEALAPRGMLFANFCEDGVAPQQGTQSNTKSSGWLYPGCVRYTWEEMRGLIEEHGLVARRLDWIQTTWFVAAHPEAEDAIESLSSRLRHPLQQPAAGVAL